MTKRISSLQRQKQKRNRAIALALAVAIGAFGFLGFQRYEASQSAPPEQSITQYTKDVDAGRVKAVKVVPEYLFQRLEVELADGKKYYVSGPHLDNADARTLAGKGIQLEFMKPSTDWRLLPSYLMVAVLLLIVLSTFAPSLGIPLMRSARRSSIGFADVAGNEEAKAAMQEVVDYLRDPSAYEAMGAQFPKGIIMDGPPGTGKTLLAKAVAGEAGASFMAVSGSDFSSMFVGVSGMKVRGMFAKARRSAPCVLFIDEIDAIGGHRLSEGTATAREMSSTLNSLLVMMDGFEENSGVVVIAATNRIELLDPALLRSGRFDRHIHVQLPTLAERQAILRLHGRDAKLVDDFDYAAVAKGCTGMAGADLANVMNQAALIAVREKTDRITTAHALMGRDRVTMGDARLMQARAMSARTRQLLAIHEAGHALIGMLFGPDEVTRISIVPRGQSLGQTMLAPTEDVLLLDHNELIARVRLLLGGRAAEHCVAGTLTTGAADDLQRATRIALDFVGRYAMDTSLLVVDEKSSDLLKKQAEDAASELLRHCMGDAISAINSNRALFDEIVVRLLDCEEIAQDEVRNIAARLHARVAIARANGVDPGGAVAPEASLNG